MDKLTIAVPNVFEYNTKDFSPLTRHTDLSSWMHAANSLSDSALFWASEKKIVFSNQEIDSCFIEYITDKLKYENVINYYSSQQSPIFSWLVEDPLVINFILNLAEKYQLELLAWGATAGYYKFLNFFSNRGLDFITNESPPEDDSWLVSFLDAKSGFRSLCSLISGNKIELPEGYICSDVSCGMRFVRKFLDSNKNCILKSDIGVGGVGLINIDVNWGMHNDRVIRSHLQKKVEELNHLFSDHSMVIEEKIEQKKIISSSRNVVGAFFVNLFITSCGEVKIIGGGNELRNQKNNYIGAQMGKDSFFENEVSIKCEEISKFLGNKLSEFGYIGHIGFDYLIDINNRLYILEANPRRCSEAHIYNILERVIGPNWKFTNHILIRLPLRVRCKEVLPIPDLINVFEQINRQLQNKSLIIPVNLSGLKNINDPGLGYIVIAQDKREAEEIDLEFRNRINKLGLYSF